MAKHRRRYSDEERAACVAALSANGGDLTRTARQCGVPRKTLEHWAKRESHPEAAIHGEAKKPDLAALFDAFVGRVLALTTDQDIAAASLKDRIIAAAVAVDKGRLLRGEPTTIGETRSAARLEEFRKRYGRRHAEGHAGGDAGGEPVRPSPADGPAD